MARMIVLAALVVDDPNVTDTELVESLGARMGGRGTIRPTVIAASVLTPGGFHELLAALEVGSEGVAGEYANEVDVALTDLTGADQ